MRTTLLVLAALLAGGGPRAGILRAQHADRHAVEAVLDALPPGDLDLYISPVLAQRQIQGNVLILEEHRERLKTRYGAQLERPEELVRCEDQRKPETCTMPEGAILYQFLMPEPLDENGILTLRVARLKSEKGSRGKIHREDWIMALAQRRGLGWDVLKKELLGESDLPWEMPGGRGGGL